MNEWYETGNLMADTQDKVNKPALDGRIIFEQEDMLKVMLEENDQ